MSAWEADALPLGDARLRELILPHSAEKNGGTSGVHAMRTSESKPLGSAIALLARPLDRSFALPCAAAAGKGIDWCLAYSIKPAARDRAPPRWESS